MPELQPLSLSLPASIITTPSLFPSPPFSLTSTTRRSSAALRVCRNSEPETEVNTKICRSGWVSYDNDRYRLVKQNKWTGKPHRRLEILISQERHRDTMCLSTQMVIFMSVLVLQRARCCFCFGDDTGKKCQIIPSTLSHLCAPPPPFAPPASPARSKYTEVPSRSVCTQMSCAHCYSSDRLRMGRKHWSANRDDVTVTRMFVWHSEAAPAAMWNC